MLFVRPIAALGIAASVVACAVPPPSGPSVLALPGKGKDLTTFQQDDAACRQYAASLVPTPPPAAPAAPPAHPAGYGQPYDVSYTQCMVSRGDTVPTPPPQPIYASVYPGYYDDLYGPGFYGPGFGFGTGIFVGGWHDHGGPPGYYRRGGPAGGVWHRDGGGGPRGSERP